MQPSPQFTDSISANIVYWRQRTQNLTDDVLPALDQERQNLYRAVKYGLCLPATWQETAELILQTLIFIERRGYWAEWIPVMEQLLESCPVSEVEIRGRILNYLGIFYKNNRQLQKAYLTHQAELQIGNASQDKWRQAHAAINLGSVCRQLYKYDEAETYILDAQEKFQAIKAPLVKHAFVFMEMGLLMQAKAQLADAEAHLSYAVSLFREGGDPVYLANSLKLLGQVFAAQDKIEEASNAYHEALDNLSQTENHLDESRVLNELGILSFNQGKFAEATRLFKLADSPFLRQSGNLYDQALFANNLGNVYQAQEKLEDAERSFQRSIHLWQICDEPIQLANSLSGLAEIHVKQEQIAGALNLYQQALDLLAQYPQDSWANKLRQDCERNWKILKNM
jgi:tetratricopeptide (TPR) repeat protein